jgi:glycosyltransferase involved in cell wall biosynthesis
VNVLQVSTSDRGGGAETVALSLHRALRARGHDAWLAVGTRWTGDEGVLTIGSGEPVEQPRIARLARALRDPGVLVDLGRGREDFRFPESHRVLELPPRTPDVLHLHNLHGGYFDLRLLPFLTGRVPTAVTMHDEWLYTGHCAYTLDCERWLTGCGRCPHLHTYPSLLVDGTAENRRRKRALYEQARMHVVLPSRWLADRAVRSILEPAIASSRVIPNGVDLDVFAPGGKDEARARLDLPQDAHVLVFAAQGARSNPYKDFGTLRAALARLGAEAGPPVVALALGEEAEEERLGRVSLRSSTFLGRREVADRLRAADLYVHSARAENHPLAVLEALACGTPVVASRVGGIPEQVSAETGLLVRPGDAEALAAAVSKLLADADQRARLAQRAADDARARFSLARQVDAYLELYAELAADG